MSSHDAINYYALMVGMNRKTAGRAVGELAEKELIWIVPREEKKRLKKSKPMKLLVLTYSETKTRRRVV